MRDGWAESYSGSVSSINRIADKRSSRKLKEPKGMKKPGCKKPRLLEHVISLRNLP